MLAKYSRCCERNAPVVRRGALAPAGNRLEGRSRAIPDPGDGVEIPDHPVRSQYARRFRRPPTPSRLTAPPFQIATRISRLTARSSRSMAIAIQIMAIESRLTTIRSRLTTRNSPDKRPASRVPGYMLPFFAAGNQRQGTENTWVSSQTMRVKPEFFQNLPDFPVAGKGCGRPVRRRLLPQPCIPGS